MSCREEGAGFEAGDALEFCFLETDNGGGGEGGASLTVSHFSESLRPRTFHEMVERVVLECLAIREHDVHVVGEQTKPGMTITSKCA